MISRGKCRKAIAPMALVLGGSLLFTGSGKTPDGPVRSPENMSITVASPAEVYLVSAPPHTVMPSLPDLFDQQSARLRCFILSGSKLTLRSTGVEYTPKPLSGLEPYEFYLRECPSGSTVDIPDTSLDVLGIPSFTRDLHVRRFAITVQGSLERKPFKPRIPFGIIS